MARDGSRDGVAGWLAAATGKRSTPSNHCDCPTVAARSPRRARLAPWGIADGLAPMGAGFAPPKIMPYGVALSASAARRGPRRGRHPCPTRANPFSWSIMQLVNAKTQVRNRHNALPFASQTHRALWKAAARATACRDEHRAAASRPQPPNRRRAEARHARGHPTTVHRRARNDASNAVDMKLSPPNARARSASGCENLLLQHAAPLIISKSNRLGMPRSFALGCP